MANSSSPVIQRDHDKPPRWRQARALTCACTMWLTAIVGGTAAFTVAGCADEESAPPPAVEGELSAVIGPDGGTIDGAGVLGFEGVRVVIPAGALASDTTVTVRAVSEAEPLPTLGEQCGQSYLVDGGGAALAQPIAITLPVDASIVDDFGQSSTDVAVWVKGGDGWESVEPNGTTDGSVTFEVARFTSAAAGVKRPFRDTLCALQGVLCGTTAEVASSAPACPGPAYCIEKIGGGAKPETGTRLTTDGTQLYFTTRPATNQVAVVKINPESGDQAPSASFTTTSTVRRNVAVSKTSPEAWLGIGVGGNIRFKFDGSAPVAFDTDALGHGAVALSDGTLTRLSSKGFTTRQTTSQTFEARVDPLGSATLQDLGHAHADPDYATRTIMLTLQFGLSVFELVPNPNAPAITSTTAFESNTGVRAKHRPGMGREGNDGDGFSVHAQTQGNKLVVFLAGGGQPNVLTGMPHGVDAIVAANGDVWIASLDTPELALVRNILQDGTRSVEMIPLSSASPGTDAFTNALPRGIAELNDGRIIVQQLNGDILLIRKPGT